MSKTSVYIGNEKYEMKILNTFIIENDVHFESFPFHIVRNKSKIVHHCKRNIDDEK